MQSTLFPAYGDVQTTLSSNPPRIPSSAMTSTAWSSKISTAAADPTMSDLTAAIEAALILLEIKPRAEHADAAIALIGISTGMHDVCRDHHSTSMSKFTSQPDLERRPKRPPKKGRFERGMSASTPNGSNPQYLTGRLAGREWRHQRSQNQCGSPFKSTRTQCSGTGGVFPEKEIRHVLELKPFRLRGPGQ